MTTTSVAATTNAATTTSQSAKAAAGLSQTYDTFLKLLTTQLKNQDPLSPMDSTKFTEQLVQYSSVEQQISQNKNLETMISLLQGGQTTNAVGYIGREVEAKTSKATLGDDGATWRYSLGTNSAVTQITVTNASGLPVYATTGSTASGEHEFTWNGKDSAGNKLPAGDYTVTVTARDAAGSKVTSNVSVGGTVTGVEMKDGTPLLIVGGSRLSLSDIVSVTEPTS
jgi:flagellar basal-body rod modification protein FlgD